MLKVKVTGPNFGIFTIAIKQKSLL